MKTKKMTNKEIIEWYNRALDDKNKVILLENIIKRLKINLADEIDTIMILQKINNEN